MDFKSFMNTVEENLSLIKTEDELRNWIRNYARSIPEEERGSFLEQMQTRKPRSHKEILKELTDWCEKVEEGEDLTEMGIEDMVSEKLVSLNLKQIAALTLYSIYQAYELPERIRRLYSFFSRRMFKDTGIEDMMSAGREPLRKIDEFLKAWIKYLRKQNDSYTSRLLIEAVTFRSGTDGLLEEAKRTADQHPGQRVEQAAE